MMKSWIFSSFVQSVQSYPKHECAVNEAVCHSQKHCGGSKINSVNRIWMCVCYVLYVYCATVPTVTVFLTVTVFYCTVHSCLGVHHISDLFNCAQIKQLHLPICYFFGIPNSIGLLFAQSKLISMYHSTSAVYFFHSFLFILRKFPI